MDDVAWSLADELLHDASMPQQVHFLCSQTLRTKVERDFDDLPENAFEPLRDSLMSLLFKFGEGVPSVRTQLCLALAAMTAHVPRAKWGANGPVAWFAEKLGSASGVWPAMPALGCGAVQQRARISHPIDAPLTPLRSSHLSQSPSRCHVCWNSSRCFPKRLKTRRQPVSPQATVCTAAAHWRISNHTLMTPLRRWPLFCLALYPHIALRPPRSSFAHPHMRFQCALLPQSTRTAAPPSATRCGKQWGMPCKCSPHVSTSQQTASGETPLSHLSLSPCTVHSSPVPG